LSGEINTRYALMRRSKGKAKSRFIDALDMKPSLAEEAFELRSANREVVEAWI
jgi:hypothetical protein